eukprot:PhF_6_TR38750/c0_g1_i1/m.58017
MTSNTNVTPPLSPSSSGGSTSEEEDIDHIYQMRSSVREPNWKYGIYYLFQLSFYLAFTSILTVQVLWDRSTQNSFLLVDVISTGLGKGNFEKVYDISTTYTYIIDVMCPAYVNSFVSTGGVLQMSSKQVSVFQQQSNVISPLRIRQHRVKSH